MLNRSAKGGRIERKVSAFLESHGYSVSLSRLSKGLFDRVARRSGTFRSPSGEVLEVSEVRLIQVKANAWRMPKADCVKMGNDDSFPGSSKEYWRVMDIHGLKNPDPKEFMQARRVLQDGSWIEIPLLPEWDEEMPLLRLLADPRKPPGG